MTRGGRKDGSEKCENKGGWGLAAASAHLESTPGLPLASEEALDVLALPEDAAAEADRLGEHLLADPVRNRAGRYAALGRDFGGSKHVVHLRCPSPIGP